MDTVAHNGGDPSGEFRGPLTGRVSAPIVAAVSALRAATPPVLAPTYGTR